jgi:hypothetical protein
MLIKKKKDVEQYVQKFRINQFCENPSKKYGYLSKQDINQNPWHTIWVNPIGTYSVTEKQNKELNLLATIICNPVTGCFDVSEKNDKISAETSK